MAVRQILVPVLMVLITLLSCMSTPYDSPYSSSYESTTSANTIFVDQETPPISVSKVIIQIAADTKIGAHHDGLLSVPQYPYHWQTSTVVADVQFNEIINDELENAGYNVLGSTSALFDTNEPENALFLLGARITKIQYDTYGPLAGDYSSSSVEVEWELMDKTKRKVVYSNTTYGWHETSRDAGLAVTHVAFRHATRRLLRDPQFVENIIPKEPAVKVEDTHELIDLNVAELPRFTSTSEMVNRAIESVVTIKTGSGHASGVILSQDGYLVTNYHVIEGEHSIDVIFYNGFILETEVVRTDPEYDLALLKIDGAGFPALPLCPAADISIADDAFAIGTPALLELGQSISKGIISGRRMIEGKEYIQTDVTINPGNSGGPLINSAGHVLGIVTMKMVGTELEGLGFCIPAAAIKDRLGINHNQ